MGESEQYEILAVRYGVAHSTKAALYHRFHEYREPDERQDMDFFFYVLRQADRVLLVDTGFRPASTADRPGRECVTPPMDALARLGIAPESVPLVIVTHFHWDHIGNVDRFPAAELVVPQAEVDFWSDPVSRNLQFRAHVDDDTVEHVLQACRDGRARTSGADEVILPGIRAITVGGHAAGQQILVVDTARGPVVLASDAAHLYEEAELARPFGVTVDVAQMCRAYALLGELAAGGALVVPGHDPLVTERFPTLPGDAAGVGFVIA